LSALLELLELELSLALLAPELLLELELSLALLANELLLDDS
jgi:hypothetical protein